MIIDYVGTAKTEVNFSKNLYLQTKKNSGNNKKKTYIYV